MALRKWTFTVGPDDVGLRLDQLVAAHTDLSRRQAREVLKLGGVQVQNQRVRVASKLIREGHEVRVAWDPGFVAPPDQEIPVIFEDEWILAVAKPAGIPTQGTWTTDQHDLLALLRRQRPGLHLYLHHRLDLGTSGVLVLSKSKEANAGLSQAFEGRGITKTYLARTATALPAPVSVDAPIGRLRLANPGRFASIGDLMDPREARTDFRPATAEETAGLKPGHYVVATPHTGRTHQIRVHLALLGLPLVGDPLYGGMQDEDGLGLHAWKLAFTHPVTALHVHLEAPPRRFQEGV
ncbi:MAG TPA: RluA family pseudouridine synthase [Holophagaceae bacterium]|nr:RluA family pseudouridine synthase [Holophagaceae bacterium]